MCNTYELRGSHSELSSWDEAVTVAGIVHKFKYHSGTNSIQAVAVKSERQCERVRLGKACTDM